MEKLYTVDQVAESFQMPKSTVTELCKREGWPHHRIGKAIRFTEEQVREILARHLVTPEATVAPMFPGARPRRDDRLSGQTTRSAARNYRTDGRFRG